MFDFTKGLFGVILKVSDRFWELVAVFAGRAGGTAHWLIGKIAILALRLVDKEKVEGIIAQGAMAKQQAELELMSSASQLRDHAVETGEWKAEHTIAINAIGVALIDACDWEEAAVHNYLRGVVEAVPGLEYGLEPPGNDLGGLL